MGDNEPKTEGVLIRGLSGWREGAREQAVRDGIHAAARVLAARGVDCRGALDLRDEVPAEIEVILAHVREVGRQTITVPGPLDVPIPGSGGEEVGDPRLATPEGRLEMMKEAAADGRIEIAPDERGGFVVQWSSDRGFGEVTFRMDAEGRLSCGDEMEGRMGVMRVLLALIQAARFDSDPPATEG